MTYKVHGYCDDKMILRGRMEHLPRHGDTIRLSEDNDYAKVTEVIWCIDEQSSEGQRVNLRMETI